MAISKENNKTYNDKFIAKIAEAIGVSPFNNPESWGDDPDNDFENDVLKHPFDKNNQDDVKQYHDYFGMGIGRNGPWKPLEDDEIIEYLKNHPQEIELWVDDVDWDDEKDGSKFTDNTPDDPDESSDKPHDDELVGETTPEEKEILNITNRLAKNLSKHRW